MLKMYQSEIAHSGSSPDFWEENWASSKFEESVRFMNVDPLRPLFEKYLKPDSLMLEGGCGIGNYIAYYSARGVDVVGLDFAQNALASLHIRQPHLKLVGGDVSNFPFADKTFDLYYSGGVVEHFEDGAERSLSEARRVLKDDGILLISVPYFSPLRRFLVPFRRNIWKWVDSARIDEKITEQTNFFQYAYRQPEFIKMLSSAGLETIETQGYAVLWGIQELSMLRRSKKKADVPERTEPGIRKLPEKIDIHDVIQDRPRSLLKRLVVSEDHTVPILGLGVKFMRWSVANMMMYVCRRN